MKKIKILTFLFVTMVVLSQNNLVSNAKTSNILKGKNISMADKIKISKTLGHDSFDVKGLSGFGRISYKDKMCVGKAILNLYPTFDSNENAISEIKKNPTVTYLKKNCKLPDISIENWEEYESSLWKQIDSGDEANCLKEDNDSFIEFVKFLDIIENNKKNDVIIDSIYNNTSLKELIQDKTKFTLLPQNTIDNLKSVELINGQKAVSAVIRNGFNVDKGVAYASLHATKPNTPAYQYFWGKGDCTNFVSQILEYGGVKQVYYNDENKGWWHLKLSNDHVQSVSWRRADTFAKYMGVKYTTKTISGLSANVTKGDFIGYDRDLDGDWEHMGFVTARESKKNKNGYYDFKVAQHSSNYHLWVSSKDNGWENIGKNGGKYGRIRR